MDSRTLFLTANTESVYGVVWLDLSDGPVVMEREAGRLAPMPTIPGAQSDRRGHIPARGTWGQARGRGELTRCDCRMGRRLGGHATAGPKRVAEIRRRRAVPSCASAIARL
ncbi:MAG: DUF1254 domain-containing protein [Thermoanaerobaculales bacterium]